VLTTVIPDPLGRRLRGIHRYVLSSFSGTHDHTMAIGGTKLSRKKILLSCSWCFLRRSSLMTPSDNYSTLILRRHIAFVSPAELACQLTAREQNLSPIRKRSLPITETPSDATRKMLWLFSIGTTGFALIGSLESRIVYRLKTNSKQSRTPPPPTPGIQNRIRRYANA